MTRISDLWSCAYLVCNGIEITNIEVVGSNGKRSVFFIFSDPEAKKLQTNFLAGRAVANVTRLKGIMTHLKDLLFSKLREREVNINEKYFKRSHKKRKGSEQYC